MPNCSLNEKGSLVGAREQIDFFLLRKQPHSDSLEYRCEVCELAHNGKNITQH